MNGNQTRNATRAQIKATNTAIRLPPVLIKAPIPIGVGHGICAITGGINCNLIAKYATVALANGAKMNGTAINGLNTTGKPKIIGSLMLNSPGGTAALPITRNCCDFAKKAINMAKPNVAPDPPIMTNALLNSPANG